MIDRTDMTIVTPQDEAVNGVRFLLRMGVTTASWVLRFLGLSPWERMAEGQVRVGRIRSRSRPDPHPACGHLLPTEKGINYLGFRLFWPLPPGEDGRRPGEGLPYFVAQGKTLIRPCGAPSPDGEGNQRLGFRLFWPLPVGEDGRRPGEGRSYS